MKPHVWLLVFLFGLSGCALPVRTHGVVEPVSWSTTDFNYSSGSTFDGYTEQYDFILTLQERQGRVLTFTGITWEVWQRGVDLSGRETRTGSWSLPANGTLQLPFVYRIFCPSSAFCPDLGLTMQWDISFAGQDAQGQPVHVTMQPELPWLPLKPSANSPSDRQIRPSVVLHPIHITVPRLYYPRVGR